MNSSEVEEHRGESEEQFLLITLEVRCTPGMVGLAFFVTGLGWSGLASFLSNRAGLERAGLGWQVLTKTGLQGFSLA